MIRPAADESVLLVMTVSYNYRKLKVALVKSFSVLAMSAAERNSACKNVGVFRKYNPLSGQRFSTSVS